VTDSARTRNTAGYYLLFVCLGFGMGITGPALPSLANQTRSTLGSIGAIFLVGAMGYTAGTVMGGWILDRVQRAHFILGLSQLISAGLMAVTPLVGSLPALLLIVFLNGLPNGMLNTGVNTLLMWTHGERSGPYMNGLHLSFGMGAFLAPFIYSQILRMGGTYQQVYWTLAGIAVPIALFMLFLPGNPKRQHGLSETTSGRDDLRKYMPIVVAGSLFLFFYVSTEMIFANWIYTYTLTLNLGTATQAAYLTSGFWLAFTIGRMISIPAAVRFKSQHMLGFVLTACILITALLIAFPSSFALLWVCTICLGFFMAPVWPMGYQLAGQSVKLTATISSIILLGDSLGGMILPSLTGPVVEHFGVRTMVWLVFVSLVGNVVALLGMVRLRHSVPGKVVMPD
jgi:MFS transporter, FHS family, Na+ dependent glucose transporter 1